MRLLKITLIALLVVVTIAFGFTRLDERLSGANEPPKIQCDSELLELSVRDNESALLAGITAYDAQDGDLTASVQVLSISKLITNDTAKVTYVVFDSHDNIAAYTRRVRYTDYARPTFQILTPLVYAKNQPVVLLDRIKVIDVLDGDITQSVRVSALSGTADSEVYTATLQVTNSLGDTSRLTVPVILMEGSARRAVVHLSTQIAYLERDASFSALDYLTGVTIPGGTGDTTNVQISGNVDTSNPGTYMVYYRYPHNGTVGLSILTVVVK